MKGGSKYQPLLEYLQRSDCPEITLSFTEIEKLINSTLPNSARKERRWWGNRSTGSPQASAWMKAGYVVELNLESETVTFRKPTSSYKVQTATNTMNWNSETIKALRLQMGLSQKEFAEELGVRQQTVSEWETSVYEPTRATSKLLSMVAEKAGFKYKSGE
ncbi:transcriptional regulator [Fischerella thermalis CCMEE 5205]|uniref:Transcriptional regulator n=1 Tax=Fischerella thermalis CCMEE 5318 TaxID=2019666 RepID=A0A2N6LM66_9CYAN|nr:helix-turn-helix transcriptional regulator [Fischerella thermalis]PMB26349.1 transcriptional regulator [Fischerella thermalis CCMEE 5318]PMB49333.1 transcriptional regulator [Fischerella thermalis CCMEE 5205]